MDPLTIAIITLLISTCIAIAGFFIKRKFFNVEPKVVRAGFHNKGKGTIVIGSTMTGPDAGLIDEGEDLTVIDSKMKATGKTIGVSKEDK